MESTERIGPLAFAGRGAAGAASKQKDSEEWPKMTKAQRKNGRPAVDHDGGNRWGQPQVGNGGGWTRHFVVTFPTSHEQEDHYRAEPVRGSRSYL